MRKIRSYLSQRRCDADKRHWVVPREIDTIEKLQKLFKTEEIVCEDTLINMMLEIESPDCDCQEIFQAIENLLQMKGYSKKTIKAYVGHIQRFLHLLIRDLRS